MSKFSAKRLFQIEYILIFIAALTFITAEVFKKGSNRNFSSLDKNFSTLQLNYGTNRLNSEENEWLLNEIQKDALPYIYFSSTAKQKLIRILALYKYGDENSNANSQNSDEFNRMVITFYSDIKAKQGTILFGYDCLSFSAIFLLFLAFVILIGKIRNQNSEAEAIPLAQNEKIRYTPSDIIKISVIVVIAVAANFIGSVVSHHISVQLYLDSILTMGVTAFCGLIPGLVCAILSNLVLYIFDYTMIWFVSCHILTAVFAYLAFRRHRRLNATNDLSFSIFLWGGLWSGLSNAILGNILADTLISQGNTTPILEGSVLCFFISVQNLTFANYLSGIFTNLADKMFSAALSFIFYTCLKRTVKLRQAEKVNA